MGYRTFNVLILCTGNSTRSIMAEALFNTMGNGMFKAYSAGSYPTGVVNRFAIEEVKLTGYPIENLRSKSWEEFSKPNAPEMDFVITICDAEKEICPVWHGNQVSANWPFEDPADAEGTFKQKKEAFKKVFIKIQNRIDLLSQLPLAHLDKMSLKHKLNTIGKELADL